MNPIPEVIECSVVGPTKLRLRFRDGWVGTLDLGPALSGAVFGALAQPERFREVVLRDGTLTWPAGADICPSVLRYWCELGRVCPQAELDAHFESLPSRPSSLGKVAESKSPYSPRANR